ncbi:MAG: hypothetical protein U1A27_12530 [Phycisphaerae bacterium]
MTARNGIRCTLVAVVVWAAAGCNPEHQLAPRTNWYVSDVPVPQGFSRNIRESMYSTGATGRRILDVYEGGAEPIKVRNFYVTNMQSQGWAFEDESLEGQVYMLHFKKSKETCTITVSKRQGLFAPTQARVNLDSSRETASGGKDERPGQP